MTTAPTPEGTPPHAVHQAVIDMVQDGELDPEVLDLFYEGYLVYDEDSRSVVITHAGRKHFEEGHS